jgi:DnaK suppressor protein
MRPSKRVVTEAEELNETQLETLKNALLERRHQIVNLDNESIEAARESQGLRHADEVDLAAAEWDVTVEQRMRVREKGLLKKIEKALARITEGTYGECENFDTCGNYIGYKRLLARPEANLCITCKEEQELVEKKFMQSQTIEDPFTFE